jgi:hypothetical protein
MQIIPFAARYAGIPIGTMFPPPNSKDKPLAAFSCDAFGSYKCDLWNVPNVPMPTPEQLVEAAGAPEPADSLIASLLAYASRKQNKVLAQVWTFNVGTADAPLNVTTLLDPGGQFAMLKVAQWASMNAASSTALMPYSNIDFTSASLTPAQAASLATQAGNIDAASYGTLNSVSAEIKASPPTITTTAQIDSAAWPSPS